MKTYIKALLLGSALGLSYNLYADNSFIWYDYCAENSDDRAACKTGIDPKPAEPNLTAGRIVFDFDTDGCLASSPIIKTEKGYEKNPGLEPVDGYSGNCVYNNQLERADVLYSKICNKPEKGIGYNCAEVFALYTVKDIANLTFKYWNHRHDFEHVIIWSKNGVIEEIGVSAHHLVNNTPINKFPRLSSDPLNPQYRNFSVVYHKHGLRTHALRPSKSEFKKNLNLTVNTETPENPTGRWFAGNIVDVSANSKVIDAPSNKADYCKSIENKEKKSYRDIVECGDWGSATLKIRNEETARAYLNKHQPQSWKKEGIKF